MVGLRFTFWTFFVGMLCLSAGVACGQPYPNRPIRLVVPSTPGGGTDVAARTVAQKLNEIMGQPVIVENRAGANGAIAAERVATSPPDGYTLLLMNMSTTIIESTLRGKLPYDLKRDFAPVSLLVSMPFVLVVHPSVPVRNVKELIALARSQPGKLNYGADVAGAVYLAGALFTSMAKVNIVHVPYKGGAEYVIAVAAGQVGMCLPTLTAVMPFLTAGKLRPLAVSSTKRTSVMPSIPTLDEAGLPGYDYTNWNGVIAPASVERSIISRLNEMIGKAVNTPQVRESLHRQGLEPQTNTPEEFAVYIHREIAQNAKLISLSGAKAE